MKSVTGGIFLSCLVVFVLPQNHLSAQERDGGVVTPRLRIEDVSLYSSSYADVKQEGHRLTVQARRGFDILSLTPGVGPTLLGTVDTPGEVQETKTEGGLVYVADGYKGLRIVDVGEPSHPTVLGKVGPVFQYGRIDRLAVRENMGYLYESCDYGAAIRIFDLSDPSNPEEKGVLDLPWYVSDMKASGSHLFFATSRTGLAVADVSDPFNPVIVWEDTTPEYGSNLALAGDRLFIAVEKPPFSLQKWDIANPAAPVLEGETSALPQSMDIAGAPGLVFILTCEGRVECFAVSDPGDPVFIAKWKPEGSPDGIEVGGTTLYVATRAEGLLAYDVASPQLPQLLWEFKRDPFVSPSMIAVSGEYGFVTVGNGRIATVRLKSPFWPRSVWEIGGQITAMEASGGLLYIAFQDQDNIPKLRIADLAHPFHPPTLSEIRQEDAGNLSANGLSVDEGFLYISYCCHGWGLTAYDVSNPEEPAYLGHQPQQDLSAEDVLATHGRVYLALASREVRVYSTWPFELLYQLNCPSESLSNSEDILLVSGGNRLTLYDISGGGPPVLQGLYFSRSHGYFADVAAGNGFAYLAAGRYGVEAVDLSNPMEPTLDAWVDTPCNAASLGLLGRRVFVADEQSFLRLYHSSQVWHPQIGASGLLQEQFLGRKDWAKEGSDPIDGLIIEPIIEPAGNKQAPLGQAGRR